MINCVTFIERYKHIYAYLLSSESEDLAQSAEENGWTIEECMNQHVLGHAVVMAHDLGLLEGSPDEEICEIISRFSDYYPPSSSCPGGE